MIVVSDTSPITNLLKIGRLELLHDLFGIVVIPAAVEREIDFFDEPGRSFRETEWVKIVELKHRELYNVLTETLDPGEAEAIAVSLEINADVLLIDEIKGRREATDRGLQVTGLIGVLLDAKKGGLIELVKPEIDKLVTEARFWLSPQLIYRSA